MSFLDGIRAPSTTGRQTLIVVAVALVIGVLLVGGYAVFLRKPYGVLFSNLRPADAATIVAELDKKKIPYRLADGGSTILTPRAVVDQTRIQVAGADLPLKGAVGFELFNKSDMGLTEFAQKINYQRALQGELARTIMTLDEVESARVHLSLAEPTIFRDDRRPPKASATIIPRQGRAVSPEAIHGIQRLIAAAVPDLDPADVVILDEDGRIVSGEAAVSPARTPASTELKAIADFYAVRVRQVLAAAGQAPVGVDVEIDPLAARTSDLDHWSPTTRSFPLRASVYLQPLPGLAEQQQLRQNVLKALGGPPDVDAVSLLPGVAGGEGMAAPAIAPVAAASPTAARPPSPSLTPRAFWLAVLIPLILGLLAIAALLWRRRNGPAMTPQRRDRYVARLERLLAEEEAHAAAGN